MNDQRPLSAGLAILSAGLAAACFHFAFATSQGLWMLGFPIFLLPLVRLPTARLAFYGGLILGFGLYGPLLGFFWGIFGPAALVLWGILGFWVGLFLALGRGLHQRLPSRLLVVALPVLWTGLEYFRSELYYLRFSWLTPGAALAPALPASSVAVFGAYGLGFLLFLVTAAALFLKDRTRLLTIALVVGAMAALSWPRSTLDTGKVVRIAGAQTETVAEDQLPKVLSEILRQFPDTELLVLSEYCLEGTPDAALREWCRTHRRHVIAGGREKATGDQFFNTAFVIGPDGEIVFRQAKSVPIQFFKDGQPAETQRLWDSPWGRIGIAICYDLSYARVIDSLIRQGAELLVIPTMDAWTWGRSQHLLHARVAPLRAAEYGVPIVRIASSGISQWVNPQGKILASGPCSEETAWTAATVAVQVPGRLPLDRWLAPCCSAAVGLALLGWYPLTRRQQRQPRSPKISQEPEFTA